MTRKTKAQTLDELVKAVRAKGFTVRFANSVGSPNAKIGMFYEVFNEGGFAIRDEAGLQEVLNGTDYYFKERGLI